MNVQREFPPDLSAVLYVRADTQVPTRRDAVIDRLTELRRTAHLSGFEVHLWPKTVSLTAHSHDGEFFDVFSTFEEWADRHGVEIRPPFDVHTVRSTITGESDERLVLPELCLIVYEADSLAGVYPCHDRNEALTVGDALEAIETGEAPTVPTDDWDGQVLAAVDGPDRTDVVDSPGSIGSLRSPSATESDE